MIDQNLLAIVAALDRALAGVRRLPHARSITRALRHVAEGIVSRSMRVTVAALVMALCVPAVRVANQSANAFDKITYRDSGGFGGGGTDKSLIVTPDGKASARTRAGDRAALQLQPHDLADLNAGVAAVDWPHIERYYTTRGASDLVSRDLTVVIGGTAYETHADMLAKVPDRLRGLFDRLDALYDRAVGPAKR